MPAPFLKGRFYGMTIEPLFDDQDADSALRNRNASGTEPNKPIHGLGLDEMGGAVPSSNSPTANSTRYWVRDKDSPSSELPPKAIPMPYLDLREKALSQRTAAPASCPYPMQVLYSFWSHFLVRNFNTGMYNEFRHLALDDADNGIETGKDYLLKYYAAALNRQDPIRSRLARHYVQLAQSENGQPRHPATDQLRSAWRDPVLTVGSRMRLRDYIDPELLATLDR